MTVRVCVHARMSACTHVCAYLYRHAHVFMYVCTRIFVCAWMFMYVCVGVCVLVHVCVWACMCVNICMCLNVCVCLYMNVSLCVFVCICVGVSVGVCTISGEMSICIFMLLVKTLMETRLKCDLTHLTRPFTNLFFQELYVPYIMPDLEV